MTTNPNDDTTSDTDSDEYSDDELHPLWNYFERSVEDADVGRDAWENPKVLRALYHEHGWTQEMIANKVDASQPTVSRRMKRYDIETTPHRQKVLGEGDGNDE